MTDFATLITAFTAMFIVIDPIGMAPLFVAMTQGMKTSHRRAIAIRACLAGMIILLIFAFTGEALLDFIGISMPAFRIAGGVLLFLTALDMLFERRQQRREDNSSDHLDPASDPSIYPLAIPLIAGPGAIATIILLTGQADSALGFGAVLGVMVIVIGIVFALFMAAPLLERALGKTGINVVTRLLGMLLAALAVQFILDGLKGFGLAG
ncbi:MarC family protein [Loktanella sp. SALINAS62]|uniref:MarC family protein n=1 Tax=Loktanella sp. SALINAS62 TaxID=2706124 RepID=UPI001B8C946F|nr:MarC family protein [Loktanella sp. SALINAS62]MBS1302809.1 MarC family protein [Loktanella sp. SALINAS62]